MGKVATSPLPPRGSPPLKSRGAKSEVAHKWARWLHHPCRLGDPHRVRAGGRIRSGPQVGKVATSPLPPRGSPLLKSRGAKSEVAHKWARWLHHPCRLGDPHRFKAGGQNQKWPTSGHGGYITPAALGIFTASKQGGKIRSGPQVGNLGTSPLPPRGSPPLQSRGAESEVAHKWARWLHHPYRLGDPHRLRAGGRIRSGPQVSGQGGYITPAASGIPTASKQGGKIRSGPQVGTVASSPLPPQESPPIQSGGVESEVAHKWARWLHHPYRLGDLHRFKAGGPNQ